MGFQIETWSKLTMDAGIGFFIIPSACITNNV
jgi:hypothetical protein